MPLPWALNLWACNPFAREADRDAVVDTGNLGGSVPIKLSEVLPPIIPVKNPSDYSTKDWYDSLTEDWPTISSVIPKEKYISGLRHQNAVEKFVNKSLEEDKKRTSMVCFDYANFQLAVACYHASGPVWASDDTIMVLYEYPGRNGNTEELQIFPMIKAVEYLKQSLQSGVPVLIGLRINIWEPRPNNAKSTPFIEPTNHYVVAVGMGADGDKKYISFYDYSQQERTRLYLFDTLYMSSLDNWFTLTEVRISTPSKCEKLD